MDVLAKIAEKSVAEGAAYGKNQNLGVESL